MVEVDKAASAAWESEPMTLHAQAGAAYRRGDFQLALELYKRLATLGSDSARYTAAMILLHGSGRMQPDPMRAIEWLEQVLACSDPDLRCRAAFRLYDIYYRGAAGVSKDYKKAVRYVKNYEYVKDPTLLDAWCMYRLGVAYEFGYGVAKNAKKAMELYRRTAATGHIPSKSNLSRRRFLRGNILAILPWLVAGFHGQYLMFVSLLTKRDEPRLW